MRVLFTSVGRRVELMQAFRESAKKCGIELVIYGADISESAPALQFCDRKIICPRIKEDSYIPFLVDLCSSEKIDVLIPTIDTDLLLLSENVARFTGTRVLISSTESVAQCRDKRLTGNLFTRAGVKCPRPTDNVEEYKDGFPAFIKPLDGSSSINAFKANNEFELASLAKIIPDYIIQPFIGGTEYTVDVFCDFDGEPIYITPRIRLAVRAGEVLKTKIDQDEVIIEETKRIIREFKPCGPITVQLIRDSKTGEDYYIEINPRFGGGAPLSMKAGANSCEALYRLMQGEKVGYIAGAAENGAVYCRFDQSVRVE